MAAHPLSLLPRPISHFLGYRPPGAPASKISPPPPLKKAITLAISLTFAFLGLSVIQSVFRYDVVFTSQHLPGIITSYGATAILVFGLPASPLAQPRAVIGGHFLSALTGIIINKLFSLMPPSQFAMTDWLGGSLSTAIALVVMDLTGTTHPPAGATAILPVIQADIRDLSWNLLWIMLLSSLLILSVGMVGNNILGRYPTFWIRAEPFAWYNESKDEKPRKDQVVGGLGKETNESLADSRTGHADLQRGNSHDTQVEDNAGIRQENILSV